MNETLGGNRMKVAILGMGTVGSGVLKVIQDHQEKLAQYIGEPVEVTHMFGREINNYHNCDLTGIEHISDAEDLKTLEVDAVVEVMGGIDFTYALHKDFLSRGIHVVSANKDMLAVHVDELSELANANQAQLAYEASCGGGIPIINSLNYSLNANHLSRVMGILNGTTNYILTKMTQDNWDYDKALKEAQEKGFAEADPTSDVEGYDARRKIALLARLAFHKKIDVDQVPVQGISEVDIKDIEIAKANNLVMKLLGSAEFDGDHLEIDVGPRLLDRSQQLASVHEAMNAVFVNGDAIGEAMFYGPGAGSLETASAVVSDLANIGRFGFIGNVTVDEEADITAGYSHHPYYIRFTDSQETAEQYLNDQQISFESLQVGEDFTIVAENLDTDQVAALKDKLLIAAIYQVVRDED